MDEPDSSGDDFTEYDSSSTYSLPIKRLYTCTRTIENRRAKYKRRPVRGCQVHLRGKSSARSLHSTQTFRPRYRNLEMSVSGRSPNQSKRMWNFPEVSDATSPVVDHSSSILVPTSASAEPTGVVVNACMDCAVPCTEDQVPSNVRPGEITTECQSLPDMPQTTTDRPTPPTDPYKRARKFLYDLAPLLKLSLPSRVERKRTASVFHPRHHPTRVSDPGPSISDLRVSVCAKQWTKYGVLIQHCVTFMEPETNDLWSLHGTPLRCTRTLLNADHYVQRLWYELQLYIRGPTVLSLLDHRVSLARSVVSELAGFRLQSPSDPPVTNPEVTTNGPDLRSTPNAYLDRIRDAYKSVSQLLAKADHVEQAWSSEARLVTDVIDWKLPEVCSRLTCLRQWNSRLLILQRGIGQLCMFLRNSPGAECNAHRECLPAGSYAATFRSSLSFCPLLHTSPSKAQTDLYRSFLAGSWHMSPLTHVGSELNDRHNDQMFTNRSVHTDTGSCSSGFSIALVQLDRLMHRILLEVGGAHLPGRATFTEQMTRQGKATQTTSFSSIRMQREQLPSIVTQTHPFHSVCPTPKLSLPASMKCVSSSYLSPVKGNVNQLRAPPSSAINSALIMPSLSKQDSTYSISPNASGDICGCLSVETDSVAKPRSAWWQYLLQRSQTPKTRSYASVVKTRSWCGNWTSAGVSPSSHHSPENQDVNPDNQSADLGPVIWDVYSPVGHQSPDVASTPSSSPPNSPSNSSSWNGASADSSLSAGTSSSSSHTSSCSSLASMFRLRCTLADSPPSPASDADMLLAMDLKGQPPVPKQPDLRDWAFSMPTPSWDDGASLGLPSLVPLWLCMARTPFYLAREAVAVKLEKHVNWNSCDVQPSPSSLAHSVNELRELLTTTIRIVYRYRKQLALALKLNTVAQQQSVHFRWSNVDNHILSTEELQSDSSSADWAEHQSPPSAYKTVPVRPAWFRCATEEARKFVDGSTSELNVDLPKLLNAYVDCFVRLLETECFERESSPGELRRCVEEEWNFVRRTYRQLYRCRGGLHYISSQSSVHQTEQNDRQKPTAEHTFIRVAHRFVSFLTNVLSPPIDAWVESSLIVPTNPNHLLRSELSCAADVRTTKDDLLTGDAFTQHENGYSNGFLTNSVDQDAWASPTSSLASIATPTTVGGTRSEFNETWRERRAWLNCLLDLTGILCADLDTSVLLDFGIPVTSLKANTNVSANKPIPVGSGDTNHSDSPSLTKCAHRIFLRKLKFTGHVLLYSWNNASVNLCSDQSSDHWNQGCIFIWTPVLASQCCKNAPKPDLSRCKNVDNNQSLEFHGVKRSIQSDDPDGNLIPSDARRAVRRHVAALVYRLSQHLLFKSRKQHTSLLAHSKDSCPVLDPKRLTTNGPSKKRPVVSCRAHRSSKTSVEYLLFCPDVSSSNWDGPVYMPPSDSSDGIKSSHYRRLSCVLRWIVSMCSTSASSSSSHASRKATTTSSSTHLAHVIIPIVCWLMTDRPYSAWTALCESSARFRKWLSLGLTNSLILGGCSCFSDNTLPDRKTSRRFTVNIQLVPIQRDVCTLVATLRKSLCDLAAQLQGSLLIMESHRRSAQSLAAGEPDYLVVAQNAHVDCTLHTPPSRSSTIREALLQTMNVDNVQRAYSVVFGFHKTLVRLFNAAPVRLPDNLTTESNIVETYGPIQVRVVNLGVQLLTSWGHFVTKCYPRGRGRMPRWANDACQFAYQLCQPWSVRYLRANKLSSLEVTLNTLIPHLVGEDQSTSSVQSPVHSVTSLSTGDAKECHIVGHHYSRLTRCQSAVTAYTNRLPQSVGSHRSVHSVHSTSGTQLKRQLVHTKHTRPAKSGKSVRANVISLVDLTEAQQTDNSQRVSQMLRLLSQLDAHHDTRLRYDNLIGRPLVDFDRSCSPNPNSAVLPAEQPIDKVTLPQNNVLTRASVNTTGRRHFPYTWNRGRLIGKGVTGKVFQAFNLQTREMMAVKEIAFDYDVDVCATPATSEETQMAQAQRRLDAFRQECALLSSLSHPSLVRFLGADEQTPKVLRLFTELCSAGTLSDIVRYRPSEALVRRCAWDLACAVAYLHERGIVHRDIKPANIFLVGPPTVDIVNSLRSHKSDASVAAALRLNPGQSLLKLGDFSHSLRLHSLTSTIQGTVGTVQYMAPEVCRGLGSDYGRPCDIWSFCCVILELITGKSPWHDIPNDLAVLYKLGSDQLPKLPSIRSKRIESVVNTSMNDVPRSITRGAIRPGDNDIDDTQFYASAEAVHLLRAGINADPSKRPIASELFNFDFVQCNLGR
ncbi:hypothetical protein EG68_00933 [Paragonimus skrjabini miyazakii]|uniref:Protein kinase domain-containing protein n=1 Tax=Paragonimus skrjabini miyazakii TaxID=59628 RepID=A0A8S9Z6S8_9TREM|nr:hypothetical protein EG68_00933 [Paragonimus skrjabini miyazakii]